MRLSEVRADEKSLTWSLTLRLLLCSLRLSLFLSCVYVTANFVGGVAPRGLISEHVNVLSRLPK